MENRVLGVYENKNSHYMPETQVEDLSSPFNGAEINDVVERNIEKEVSLENASNNNVKVKEDPGYIEYRLKKPTVFEGDLIEKVVLDFNALTGKDIEDILALIDTRGIAVLENDKRYLSSLAAKAAKIPREAFLYFSATDYTVITLYAQNFILA